METIAEGWEKDEQETEEEFECANCDKTVKIGDWKFYILGKWGGSWQSFDLCLECGKDAGPFDNYGL